MLRLSLLCLNVGVREWLCRWFLFSLFCQHYEERNHCIFILINKQAFLLSCRETTLWRCCTGSQCLALENEVKTCRKVTSVKVSLLVSHYYQGFIKCQCDLESLSIPPVSVLVFKIPKLTLVRRNCVQKMFPNTLNVLYCKVCKVWVLKPQIWLVSSANLHLDILSITVHKLNSIL